MDVTGSIILAKASDINYGHFFLKSGCREYLDLCGGKTGRSRKLHRRISSVWIFTKYY